MGKPTGFLGVVTFGADCGGRCRCGCATGRRCTRTSIRTILEPPGRALHGLRHPVLQQRVPARQPDPGLERPRLPRPLAGRDRASARHEQLPRVHRAAVPGAVRVVVRARHQPEPGHDQADRGRDHRPGVGRGMGHAAGAVGAHRQAGRRDRQRARPASPPPSSSPGPATRSSCSSAPTASAGCCATASPSSRWRSATSIAASRRWRPRAPSSARTPWSARRSTSKCCGRRTTRWCSPAARPTWRDLPIPGRELDGIHQAMEYLPHANRVQLGDIEQSPIDVNGKHVVIIGGGDTGADCLGTSHRQGAASVDAARDPAAAARDRGAGNNPWPQFAMAYKVTSAHEEGGDRVYSVNTEAFLDDGNGRVRALVLHEVETDRRQVHQDRGHRPRDPGRLRVPGAGLRRSGARLVARLARTSTTTPAATSPATVGT